MEHISAKDLELLYLRYFYEHINVDSKEDQIEFINSQFRATGLEVPQKYDV